MFINKEGAKMFDARMMTGSQKILILASHAHVCEKTARRFLKGEKVSGSAGERCHLAADELGIKVSSPSV